ISDADGFALRGGCNHRSIRRRHDRVRAWGEEHGELSRGGRLEGSDVLGASADYEARAERRVARNIDATDGAHGTAQHNARQAGLRRRRSRRAARWSRESNAEQPDPAHISW